MAHKNNPYQDDNGEPKAGQMHNFFEFERTIELERRKGLTPEEVAELERAEENLARKMNV